MASKVKVSTPIRHPISSWSESPLRHLMRITILFLQQLFHAAPTGCFHWEEDDEQTEVIITREVPVAMEVLHKRPCIVLVRSPTGWSGLGMDQLHQLNTRTGAETHVDMLAGNLTFNCLSRVADEAEDLAWLVSSHVWLLRPILMKVGFHDIGQRMQIGSASPPGQLVQGAPTEEVTVVPAFTSFQFGWGGKITEQDTHVIREVTLQLEARLHEVLQPTPQYAGGGVGTGLVQSDGRPVESRSVVGALRFPAGTRVRRIRPQRDAEPPGEPWTITVKI